MKQFFSDETLQEIRCTIQQSLIETFHIMFRLDVVVSPEIAISGGDKTVCSYVEMTHEGSRAFLSIATSKAAINMICDKLEPEVSSHSSALVGDVISEITNIVSNQLRTHLDLKCGILFELSMPKSCSANCSSFGAEALNVHFNITAENNLNMEITYTETSGYVHPVP